MNPIAKLFIAANVGLYRVTAGRIGGSMFGGKVLLLSTKGAKTGRERTVPVMYFEDGGNRFVIASAGGSPTHPSWYKNLSKTPSVTVEVQGKRYEARAEVVTGAERARIWQKVVSEQPRFAGYEAKTQGREIPVVLLKEVSGPDRTVN
jgi:deazaflavin-dependent oxidoreductase (nitroreductase family)